MHEPIRGYSVGWQKEARIKTLNLYSSLTASNTEWTDDEVSFIKNMNTKLLEEVFDITPRQFKWILELWEKQGHRSAQKD